MLPTRAVVIAWLAGALVCFAVVWSVDIPLVNDGPAHLYTSYVVAHFDDATLGYSTSWQLQPTITYRGFLDVFRLLETFLSWRDAYRATVGLVAATSGLAMAVFVWALAPRRWALGLLAFPAAFQWAFFIGLFPYMLSCALGFFALALLVRSAATPRRLAAFAVLLLLAALSHPFPPAITGALALCIVVLSQSDRRARVVRALQLCVASAPAAVITLVVQDTYSEEYSAGWPTLSARVLGFGVFFQSGPAWRPVFFVALGFAGLLCTVLLRDKLSATQKSVAVAAAVGFVIGFALPWEYRDFGFMAPRVFPFPELLALSLLPVELLAPRLRAAAGLALAAYGATSMWWAYDVLHDTEEQCAYATRAIDEDVARGAHRILPIYGTWCPGVAERAVEIPTFQPTFHIAQLYSVAFGGWSGNAHVGAKHAFPLVAAPNGPRDVGDPRVPWRALREAKDSNERAALLRDELVRAVPYGTVLAMITADEVALAQHLGYRTLAHHDGFFLGQFEGCAIDVAASDSADVTVRVGDAHDREGMTVVVPRGAVVEVGGLRCGRAWCRTSSENTVETTLDAPRVTLRCAP